MAIKVALNSTGSYLPLKKSCKRPQKGHIKFNAVEEKCSFIKDMNKRVYKFSFCWSKHMFNSIRKIYFLAFLVPILEDNAAVDVSFMLWLFNIWPITDRPKINQLFCPLLWLPTYIVSLPLIIFSIKMKYKCCLLYETLSCVSRKWGVWSKSQSRISAVAACAAVKPQQGTWNKTVHIPVCR